MNYLRIIAAVAATACSALMAAAFSAAIAGTVLDPANLVDLGTTDLAINRHLNDDNCKVIARTPNSVMIEGACFGLPEETFSYLEFENGHLAYARQKFSGKTFPAEKMRVFRAMLGSPFEKNGTQTWSFGGDSWTFGCESDGWVIAKRRNAL